MNYDLHFGGRPTQTLPAVVLSWRFIGKLTLLSTLMLGPLWLVLAWRWPVHRDLLFYATILKSFSTQFWSGSLYPRWLLNVNGGLGSPVFLFYSPLAFYVASAFEWLSPFDSHGFGRLLITATALLIVAGLTSRHWLRQFLEPRQAEAGALLYATFPYLVLLLYSHCQLAQLSAIAVFPLALKAAHDLTTGMGRGATPLAIAYALTFTAHLPSAVLFAPLPWLYVAYCAPRPRRRRALLIATLAGFVGVSMAAVYWLPAIENQPAIMTDYFLNLQLPEHSFVEEYLVRVALLVLPLVGLYSELPTSARWHSLSSPVSFHLAVIVGFSVAAVPLTAEFWRGGPILRYIQFPTRFLVAAVPSTVFIAACWLPLARTRHIYQWLTVTVVAVMTVFTALLNFTDAKESIAFVLDHNMIVAPEYATPWMEQAGIKGAQLPARYLAMPAVFVAEGRGTASLLSSDERIIVLHAEIQSSEATVALKRFFFPGWQTNEGVILQQDALLAIRLPRGTENVTLTLPWFAGEAAGRLVSLLSTGAAFFGWAIITIRRTRRRTA